LSLQSPPIRSRGKYHQKRLVKQVAPRRSGAQNAACGDSSCVCVATHTHIRTYKEPWLLFSNFAEGMAHFDRAAHMHFLHSPMAGSFYSIMSQKSQERFETNYRFGVDDYHRRKEGRPPGRRVLRVFSGRLSASRRPTAAI